MAMRMLIARPCGAPLASAKASHPRTDHRTAIAPGPANHNGRNNLAQIRTSNVKSNSPKPADATTRHPSTSNHGPSPLDHALIVNRRNIPAKRRAID